MKRDPRPIRLRLARAIALIAAALAAPRASAGEAPLRILLWIRAGDLSPAELDPDPEATPHLQQLVLEGVTAADLSAEPLDAGGARDPAAAASILLDPKVRATIEERRGAAPADLKDAGGAGKAPSSAEGKGPWNHPVVALLEKRFGRPPRPDPGEEEAAARLRAILEPPAEAPPGGKREAPAGPVRPGPGEASRDAGIPDPQGLEVLKSALAAFDAGAPAVVALEAVRDPGRARERDRVLPRIAAGLKRWNAVLLLVSLRPGDGNPPAGAGGGEAAPPRAVLVIHGPGVRSGRIIGARKPLRTVSATALRILGVPPPVSLGEEAIDALGK